MFERFTDRARRTLVLAQDEARALEHSFIGPEHLLLGLIAGDGVASTALRESGLTYDAVRATVAGAISATPAAGHMDKVPFNPQAKKALELSLREALRLGHNYIGTEHILLALLRGGDGFRVVHDLLGGVGDQLRTRVVELVPSAAPGISLRSPALSQAMDRARQIAGRVPMTTGHVVTAILADAESQASKALGALGVASTKLATALAQVAVGGTSDAVPGPSAVEIKIGDVTTTVQDAELVAALGKTTPDQIREALRKAFGPGPAEREAG